MHTGYPIHPLVTSQEAIMATTPPSKAAGATLPAEALIPDAARKQLSEQFTALTRPVLLRAITVKGQTDVLSEFTRRLCTELGDLAPTVRCELAEAPKDVAREDKFPAMELRLAENEDKGPKVRFTGAPAGEEGRALLQSILLLGSGISGLGASSVALLQKLEEPRHVKVFSSPGCPYCPGQVTQAVRCALERPDLVTVECVNVDEFPDLAAEYKVGSVPHTVFTDDCIQIGLTPEDTFVRGLVLLEGQEEDPLPQVPAQQMETLETDLIILGGGPAGLSAAIYATRAGLDVVVLERSICGGQVTQTALVENYPGFSHIAGVELVEVLAAHARQYAYVREGEVVQEVKLGRKVEAVCANRVYQARALLFATGTEWRKLGVPGEKELFGRGVTHCAHCDGNLYKGKAVVVVGGGNSGLTDALQLKALGVDVSIIHWLDAFSGEKALMDAVKREEIPVHWGTEVVEILGEEKVRAVRLRNRASGEEQELPIDAVFIAVGLTPNSALAEDLGVTLAADKSILVDQHLRTNIPRIYAAGDVTGGVRQIVTAAGAGAAAAIAIAEDLQRSAK